MSTGSPSLLLAAVILIPLIAASEPSSRAASADPSSPEAAEILTPSAPDEPRVNGPTVFGVRPGSPFLYTIPATGIRPMEFSVDGLPEGFSVDSATGRITGSPKTPGQYQLVLHAKNAKGAAEKNFRIVVGDRIALTPPMGWNSWNCWAWNVRQENILESGKAMVESGLINHGWTYINIDDCWQGKRGGAFHGLQGNEKFPDVKGLADQIHAMGLKIGIYSTPWISSYGGCAGGSSDNENGDWDKQRDEHADRLGKYSFAQEDAKQWAAWGIDYLKYDWSPNDVPSVEQMSKALHSTGRDIVFSLSNSAPIEHAADFARLAECWRTTGDIFDKWDKGKDEWSYSVSEIGFSQDPWAPFAGPGHWNDPDMLVVGKVGWGSPRAETLSPDEQYSHISMWCLLSAPLLIGCDMGHLSPFTISLLSNDEVLAVDQDELGIQAIRMATVGPVDVYLKKLADGSRAVGFFNRGNSEYSGTFDKLHRIGIREKQHARDLWRQKDLPDVTKNVPLTIPAHGVLLYKFTPAK